MVGGNAEANHQASQPSNSSQSGSQAGDGAPTKVDRFVMMRRLPDNIDDAISQLYVAAQINDSMLILSISISDLLQEEQQPTGETENDDDANDVSKKRVSK